MKPSYCITLLLSIFVQAQNPEMKYSQTEFDSNSCCWRKLAASGKYEEGANLIIAYLQEGNPQNKHALQWHAGQLFAQAGNNKMALKYVRKTSNILYRWLGDEDARAWYFYVKGTQAFLERDQKRLRRIITIWDIKLPKDLNYNQLILLLENWDKTYVQALK